jgi:hypothetical protein
MEARRSRSPTLDFCPIARTGPKKSWSFSCKTMRRAKWRLVWTTSPSVRALHMLMSSTRMFLISPTSSSGNAVSLVQVFHIADLQVLQGPERNLPV